ncbi:PAS domain-containing protein [candidate division KSB1 bacterium]|nr:PAS domain-containing protein [candidate division KSB1 bacterium]
MRLRTSASPEPHFTGEWKNMIFRNFRVNTALRVILASATFYLLLYLITDTDLYASIIVVAMLFVYEIVSLIRYVELTNRKVTRFLQAIEYSDFSQSFRSERLGHSFRELDHAFAKVIDRFQSARTEKEEQVRYLQTVVQNIGTGLIIFRQDGQVDLLNNAAKRLLGVRRLTHTDHLQQVESELPGIVHGMHSGQQVLVKLRRDDQLLTLLVFATDFIQQEHSFRLVTIQNIQSELEEKEMEAWQNLIRVLTHEIMNSVTPIISLAGTAHDLLKKPTRDSASVQDAEKMEDIRDAVQTIENRSQKLMQFVDNYRQLTRIPRPDFQIFQVQALNHSLYPLFKPTLQDKRITFYSDVNPQSLELTADRTMIEQVLINLIKNAIEAVEKAEAPEIKFEAYLSDIGRPVIQISDNGPGIESHVLDNIFIPFFTTKPAGTGIGLSLSRQIMRLHSGTITVHSEPFVSTRFALRF